MKIKTLLTLFFVTSIFFLSLYLFFYSTESKKNESASTTTNQPDIGNQTPKEFKKDYKLPTGDQLYKVSHGKDIEGPKMSQVIFSPLAIKPNDKQKVTIIFPESESVGSAVVFLTTDNLESQKLNLSKMADKNTWFGQWEVNDTINKRYKVKFYIVGPSGTYSNTMDFL